MAKRVESQLYLVAKRHFDSDSQASLACITNCVDYLVVKGGKANQSTYRGLNHHYGIEKSKWFVVRSYQITATHPRAAPDSPLQRKYIADFESEQFNRKADAEGYIRSNCEFDELL
jgi:hypothetical protein